MDAQTHEARFGQLRSLLQQPPTPHRWREIAALLLAWDGARFDEQIFPYVQAHMSAGWARVAVAPASWAEALATRESAQLYALTPAVALTWDRGADEALRRIGDEVGLGHVHTLRLRAAPLREDEDEHDRPILDVARLLRQLDTGRLGELALVDVLGRGEAWEEQARALSQQLMPSLRVLDLSGCAAVESSHLAQWLDPLRFPSLEALDLTRSGTDEDGSFVLTRLSERSPLRALRLRRTLHETPLPERLGACEALANLEHLDLSDNLLEADDVAALLGPGTRLRLRTLDVGENQLRSGEGGVRAVLDAAPGALERLHTLILSDDVHEPAALEQLLAWADPPTLRVLDLSDTPEVVEIPPARFLSSRLIAQLDALHLRVY